MPLPLIWCPVMAEPACHHSVKSLAEHWNVGTDTVRRVIDNGSLKALRIGRTIRIPKSAVAAYERENRLVPKHAGEIVRALASGPRRLRR